MLARASVCAHITFSGVGVTKELFPGAQANAEALATCGSSQGPVTAFAFVVGAAGHLWNARARVHQEGKRGRKGHGGSRAAKRLHLDKMFVEAQVVANGVLGPHVRGSGLAGPAWRVPLPARRLTFQLGPAVRK